MPYIHFTEEQKLKANDVDLEEFLRRQGEKLIRSGREVRMASDHSVTIRGREWYDHAAERGGGPVSFVQRFYNKSYPEAMTMLLSGEGGMPFPADPQEEKKPAKPFALPRANKDMRRVYGYLLNHRHIAKYVLDRFVRAGMVYEDAAHHNCVFVGSDEKGVAKHAQVRSTNRTGKSFRMNVEGCDPHYSFHHRGTDGSLYVFEAPIDLLSFITLHPDRWTDHSYVACCGVSLLPVHRMMELTRVDTVYLCLDNDKAGDMASQRMMDDLTDKGVWVERLVSQGKDWNDDLTARMEAPAQEVTPLCQTML